MNDARGLKIVKSEPRSRMNFSWFASMEARSSSSEIFRASGEGFGPPAMAAIWALRQSSSAFGAVV